MAKKRVSAQPQDLSPAEIVVELLNSGYQSGSEIQKAALDMHGKRIKLELINQVQADWQEKLRIQGERRNNISTFWANERMGRYNPALRLTSRGECLDISTPTGLTSVCIYLIEKEDETFGIKVELANWVLQAIEDAGYVISRRKPVGKVDRQTAATQDDK